MRTGLVRTRGALLAALALTAGLVGGCGDSSGDAADDAGASKKPARSTPATDPAATATQPAVPSASATTDDGQGAPGAPGKTLSRAELEDAVLAKGDVAGFEVTPMGGEPPSGETADDEKCGPLTGLLGGKPEPAATAAVYRQIVGGEEEKTVVTEFLTAHKGQEAGRVLAALNEAVAACAGGFTARGGESPSSYSAVKKLPSPKAGDEALAYQLTGDFEGEEVPLVFHVVRSGTTVATYYTANLVDAKTPEIPASLAVAQAAKLL